MQSKIKLLLGASLAGLMFQAISISSVSAASCPAITAENNNGITGKYPNQFELAEFQSAANCTLTFKGNPDSAALNKRIHGNPKLPGIAERIPAEPLVVAPYKNIGQYGGTLNILSNATESGSSDSLSLRHVNLVRYSDDLKQLVPDVARSWSWNSNFTELTITLRKGHRWSDGAPFTAADIEFWFNDLILNNAIYEKTPSAWIWDGKPAKVEAVNETTVKFTMPVPTPGLMNRFAISYVQPFQPKHYLGQFMEKYNTGAAALIKKHGFANSAEAINFSYGGSDWKDVPSALLKDSAKAMSMPKAVVPTLESHLVIEDNTQGRRMVANPYFHMVDTAGNQLPYLNEHNEDYIPEKEVRNLKVVSGEVDYKAQNLFLEDFTLYKQNEAKGDYTVTLAPSVGEAIYYSFNTTDKDPEFRKVFNDVRFRQAMSLAIDRDEIIDLVYLGQGEAMQATPAEPGTVDFLTSEHTKAFTEFDLAKAKKLLDAVGLKDSDGDGVRELPSGKPMIIQMFYSNQGGPIKNHELVQSYWANLGVKMTLREISTDDYRSKAGTGEFSVTTWRDANRAGPTLSQDPFMFVPPFGDRWQPGTGFGWAQWKGTNGAEGIEPPSDVKRLYELTAKFKTYAMGSKESNEIGKEVADIHMKNLWKIGLVGKSVQPIITRNTLRNFVPFKVVTYDYYWAFSFRPQQWYLTK